MASESSDRGVWSDTEVYVLLGIWGDKAILDKMDGTCRNSEIFRIIATKMAECGYQRSVSQIKYKIKNLKRDYRKFVDHNSRSGRERRTYKFSEELGLILGDRPSSNPVSVAEVGCGSLTENRQSETQDLVPESQETDSDDDSQDSQEGTETDDDECDEEESNPQLPSSGSLATSSGVQPRRKRSAESGSIGPTPKRSRGKKGSFDELIAYQKKADEAYLREERRREREQRELEEKWRRESLDQEKKMIDVMTTFMKTMGDMVQRTTDRSQQPPTQHERHQQPPQPMPSQQQQRQRPHTLQQPTSQRSLQQQPPRQYSQHQPGTSSLHQPWHPQPGGSRPFDPYHGVDPRFLPK